MEEIAKIKQETLESLKNGFWFRDMTSFFLFIIWGFFILKLSLDKTLRVYNCAEGYQIVMFWSVGIAIVLNIILDIIIKREFHVASKDTIHEIATA